MTWPRWVCTHFQAMVFPYDLRPKQDKDDDYRKEDYSGEEDEFPAPLRLSHAG